MNRAEFGLTTALSVIILSCSSPGVQPSRGKAAADERRRASPTAEDQPAPPINVNQDIRARANAELDLKVVGGNPVPAGAMLAVVGITYGLSRSPGCTGTLIEPDIVLTAAHCTCGDMDSASTRVSNVFVGNDWSTRTGAKAGVYYQVIGFRSGISWPRKASDRQCSTGLRMGRDLALLRLRNPVRNVTPISIAAAATIDSAKSFRVAGFGAVDEDANAYPNEKFEARVPAVSTSCRGQVSGRADSDHYGCLPGEEIVAGNRSSPDSCRGDSGGPLLVTAAGNGGTGPTETFQLAGATSRGVNRAPAYCGYGGIYERLTPAAQTWIRQNVVSLRRNVR